MNRTLVVPRHKKKLDKRPRTHLRTPGLLVWWPLNKRFWPGLAMVVIAWAAEGAIWLVLSQYYHRARPVFDVAMWHQMTACSSLDLATVGGAYLEHLVRSAA